jgi:hypothetical protein
MKVNELQQELKFGDSPNGNFSAMELGTGFIRREGSAIYYRDEYVGGPWVPAGANAAPDEVNATIGGVATRKYAFDGGNTEERLSNTFEIPHDMVIAKVNDGTFKAEWHVHFAPSTTAAGVVKWFFDWCYIPPEGAPIAMTSLSCIQAVDNQLGWNMLCGAELPVPAGGYAIGGIIEFNLRRTPNDTDDTYAADALLYKTALHVPCDTDGSRERYVK